MFQRQQECHKQCVMTADAENALPPQSLQRTMDPISFLRHCTQITDFDKCRGFSCSAREFSALHILLLWLLMYPLKWNHAWPIKNKLPHTYTSCEKIVLLNTELPHSLVANKTKASQWTCAKWLSKWWKCPLLLLGGLLICLFQHS